MSTTTATSVHCRQPKWSDKPLYWATDYETFLKLKALHKWYWQTVYDVARWVRWDRKTVNQSGPEPQYCSTFVDERPCWKKVKHHVDDQVFEGLVCYPKTLVDHGVIAAYQAARTPYETEEEAKQAASRILSSSTIDSLYEEAKEFFE